MPSKVGRLLFESNGLSTSFLPFLVYNCDLAFLLESAKIFVDKTRRVAVVDICRHTLARKLSEDVAPEDKGTSADTKAKPEGVVMSCPFCGEAFVRRSNRAVICGKPECEKARKARNQRNSPKKRKVPAQQSK